MIKLVCLCLRIRLQTSRPYAAYGVHSMLGINARIGNAFIRLCWPLLQRSLMATEAYSSLAASKCLVSDATVYLHSGLILKIILLCLPLVNWAPVEVLIAKLVVACCLGILWPISLVELPGCICVCLLLRNRPVVSHD